MAEDLTAPTDATGTTRAFRNRGRGLAGLGYQLAMGLLAIGLLLSRTDPGQLSASEWLLLVLLLAVSIVCEELGFSLSPTVTVDLGGLFNGVAVLTLGFNGVWVPLLSNLYWLIKTLRRRWIEARSLGRLSHVLWNLSMNTLPWWLGLFVYYELLSGELPLTDLEANLAPTLALVVVNWLVLLAGMFLFLFITEQGVRGAVQWLKEILAGIALAVYVPILFSPALAVILNNLGLGFFLFIAVGLLGISLMAQRLARILASERRRVEELTALNALGDDIIHSPPSVAATGDLLAKHAPQFAPGADFQLCLFDGEQAGHRQIVVDWRNGRAQPVSSAPLTAPWAWLHDQRQPLHVANLNQQSLPFAWDNQEGYPRPGSLLLVPLLATDPARPEAERCIGGILMTHQRRGAFALETLPSITALANQLAAALENARLQQEALARERLEREMALARGIQSSFLPSGVPQIEGWAFVASLEPARHTSGDFYDFIPLPGNRWGVLIADVADKGMPAALFMALARTLIRAHAHDHVGDPAACLVAANEQILSDTQSDLFITVFYGILDPATGEVTYANAGHNPPLLCHRDGRPAELLRNTGMALGVVPDLPLASAQAMLAPGDSLVLYTDGVTEAHDLEYNGFGSDRLLAAARPGDGAAAEQIHRRIRAAVDEFVGAASQSDDLTLMVVGRDPGKGHGTT
jgi:serine phosphatase RsbU (regulator of sigma subunit)